MCQSALLSTPIQEAWSNPRRRDLARANARVGSSKNAGEVEGGIRTPKGRIQHAPWSTDEMGRLGVQDRYIDAFQGRTPKSVLARHYSDYSPEKLQVVYEKAGLKIIGSQIVIGVAHLS